MNPLLAQALGSFFRWALAFVAGYLVEHGIVTQADANQYVAAAALALVALVWSLWQKYKSRIHFLTALEMPAGTPETKVAERVKDRGLLPVVLLAVTLGASTSCATMGLNPNTASAKHVATVTVASSHAVLGAVQDGERTLVCGLATAPPAPACVTPARHREIAGELEKAFGLERAVVRLVRNTPAGTPTPAEAVQLLGDIAALIDKIVALVPASKQKDQLVVMVQTTGGLR